MYEIERMRIFSNQETTMFLASLAVILFVLTQVTDRFGREYGRRRGYGLIADFYANYWRTARALPGTLFAGSMLSAWLEVKDLEWAQIIAIVLLGFGTFAIACRAMMCLGELFEKLFGPWTLEWHQVKWKWRYMKEGLTRWIREWKQNTADMCWSYATISLGLAIGGITVVNMGTTALAQLQAIPK